MTVVGLFMDLIAVLARLAGRLGPSSSRWLEAELAEAARQHKVRWVPRSRWSSAVTGTCEDLSVGVDFEWKKPSEVESDQLHLCLTVSGPRIPSGLAFAAERGTGDDVLTGDTGFDDLVEVRGEPTIILALLDREIRQRVGEFVGLGGSLKAGRLACSSPTSFASGEIARGLRLGLWLARELSSPGGGVCERLAHNARLDPSPGVRLWNLWQLHEKFPETPQAREASRQDLADPSPWVRLTAARFLNDEGIETLEGLAQDRGVPESAAADAVALLAARCPVARAGPLLVAALKAHSGEARVQAVQELGRLRYQPARKPLLVLLGRADPRCAAAAAEALGALGDASAEAALLKAVDSDARELRLAAIRALGVMGSVAAVEPLLAFGAGRRLDGESRQAVRDAVGAIQSRLAGAEAGQVSLAAPSPGSGWLSVATLEVEPGRLSLLPDRKQG